MFDSLFVLPLGALSLRSHLATTFVSGSREWIQFRITFFMRCIDRSARYSISLCLYHRTLSRIVSVSWIIHWHVETTAPASSHIRRNDRLIRDFSTISQSTIICCDLSTPFRHLLQHIFVKLINFLIYISFLYLSEAFFILHSSPPLEIQACANHNQG